jgi:hypothetical protein
MRWLDRILKPAAPEPLRAAPAVRRQKNYTAESGYAYEYFYEGLRDQRGARHHVFTVSGDRKTWFETTVSVPESGIEAWQSAHGRALADNERYGVAKLALFTAFDERTTPDEMRATVVVAPERVAELLARLGIDR